MLKLGLHLRQKSNEFKFNSNLIHLIKQAKIYTSLAWTVYEKIDSFTTLLERENVASPIWVWECMSSEVCCPNLGEIVLVHVIV